MKKSEKNLLVATIAVAILGLGAMFYANGGLGGLLAGSEAADDDSLSAQREKFSQYADYIRDAPKIIESYNRVTLRNIPERRGKMRPGDTFMNELARILTDEFHQASPRVDPYQVSKIPKVEDYYFIDVDVAMDGQVSEMIRLLLQMEQRGLLIKEFTLEQRSDRRASLRVKVSRLVQHDATSRKQMRMIRN